MVLERILKNVAAIGIFMIISACTCTTPIVITEIQKTDKKLSCKDVILEINEAEHYKGLAKAEQGIGAGEALMPVCWYTSFVDANKASKAASRRIEYLGRIYDVMDCGGKSDIPEKSSGGLNSPPFIQIQPLPALKSATPASGAAKEDGGEKSK